MVTQLQSPDKSKIIYPDDNGEPMSDNTEQFRLIVWIKENLELLFASVADVFVAGNLLWYPREGNNKLSQAPDVMVAFGRPKKYEVPTNSGTRLMRWQAQARAEQAETLLEQERL